MQSTMFVNEKAIREWTRRTSAKQIVLQYQARQQCPVRYMCYYADTCIFKCLKQLAPEQSYEIQDPIDLKPYTREQDYLQTARKTWQLGLDSQYVNGIKELGT